MKFTFRQKKLVLPDDLGVVWDSRLITRHHAADMSGKWQLKMDLPYIRCAQCDGNVTMLPSEGKLINIDGLIAAVVRHMAGNHGYPLSGSAYGDDDDTAPDAARISRSNSRGIAPVH